MDFLFSSMEAWNQAGFLLGGFLLFFLAMAIIADFIWWKVKAKVFTGTITGLKAKPGANNLIYYPIVQYKTEIGETISAEANHGSSWLTNKVPGSQVEILVMEQDKETIRVQGGFWLGLGFFIMVLSFILFYISFSSYDFSLHTAGILFIFLGLASFKIYKYISKNGFEYILQYRDQKIKEKKLKKEEYPVLGKKQVMDEIKKRDDINFKWLPAGMLVGFLLVGIGVHLGLDQKYMAEAGIHTQGEVVKIYSEKNTGDGSSVYYPVVQFVDQQERSITFKDKVGSNPSSYNVGEKVTVIFDPNKLGKAMIDNGIWNWLPSFILSFMGVIIVWLCLNSLFSIRSRRSEVPKELYI